MSVGLETPANGEGVSRPIRARVRGRGRVGRTKLLQFALPAHRASPGRERVSCGPWVPEIGIGRTAALIT